jgi:hypothetical protein
MAPDWRLPAEETVPKSRDRITWRLAMVAAATFAVALVVYVIYRALLSSGITELQRIMEI